MLMCGEIGSGEEQLENKAVTAQGDNVVIVQGGVLGSNRFQIFNVRSVCPSDEGSNSSL